MSGKQTKRVTFSPDITDTPKRSVKPYTNKRATGNRKRVAGICNFQVPRKTGFSPLRFLHRLGASVARAISVFTVRRVSPKAGTNSRSGSLVPLQDCHQTEAIEDCIEFLNSSCSLRKENSSSTHFM
ncbi:uncharacterized protein LOC143878769 [Tasmannia lanceolata]|uniref:uncharacterized protein LOC143878769 n=1 Tax=Tasmannia lanceolata TaxID=3420 RepID=UPI0040640D06